MLEVEALRVRAGNRRDPIELVRSVSFGVERGEILALVGESGSGKSMTSLAVMGLLPHPDVWVHGGRITLDGTDVTALSPHQRVKRRCSGVAMIFQEPMTSLNPVARIGAQIAEAVRVHDPEAHPAHRARELLDMVRIPDAGLQLGAYPHELSGGMRQRVVIAIALACRPTVLIADEPTTALDVTVQRQILGLLRELCDGLGMGMLFITHDLGVVSQLADRVAVMYAGKLLERGTVDALFEAPLHPYTFGLMSAVPNPKASPDRLFAIEGRAPTPAEVPRGCSFAPRCFRAEARCRDGELASVEREPGHLARCHFPLPASCSPAGTWRSTATASPAAAAPGPGTPPTPPAPPTTRRRADWSCPAPPTASSNCTGPRPRPAPAPSAPAAR